LRAEARIGVMDGDIVALDLEGFAAQGIPVS